MAFADGNSEGRSGTELLLSEDLEQASEQFRLGLDASEGQIGETRQKLWYNLGLSLFGQEQYQEAADAFVQAVALAEFPETRATAAFNAGTALALASNPEEALAMLRQVLILQPDHESARHNFEFIKRQIDDQSEESGGTPPEPSAFAEEMKERADALVDQRRYQDALDVMDSAMQQDSTVAAYNDFIQRLGEVSGIEAGALPDQTQ